MADYIQITDIHTDTLKVDLVLNINGVNYVDTLPILNLGNADTFTAQLQAFAQAERSEFAAIAAAVQAAAAAQPPVVDPSVTALVGTQIPVDVVVTPTPANGGTTTAPTDGGTPTNGGTSTDGTTTTGQ